MDKTMAGKINLVIHNSIAALLTLLLGIPVISLLFKWAIGLNDSALFLFNNESLLLVIKSLSISATVALLATLIGTFFGFVLFKIKSTGFSTYQTLLTIPILISPYIFAVAWKDAFLILFGEAVYSVWGLIIVHVLVFSPLAMLIVQSALSSVNAELEEAGLMMTSFRRMVIKIIFPLVKHAVSISFLLVLVFSLTDFSVPAFFGVRTITTEIFTQFSAFYHYEQAIGQSVLLLILCLLLIGFEYKYLDKVNVFSIGQKGSVAKYYNLPQRQRWVHLLLLFAIILSIVLPIFVLLHQSLFANRIFFFEGISLLKGSIIESLSVALIAAFIISLLTLSSAYADVRLNIKFSGVLLLILFVTPSTVLGIALIHFYNQSATTIIYTSPLIIIFGYICRFGFIAHKIVGNGLRQIPVSFEEVARISGISAIKTFNKIVLPLLVPSFFTSFILVFVLCLGELGTTVLVYPPGTDLMPLKVFTISANAPTALSSMMTLINLFVVSLVIVFFYLSSKLMKANFSRT
jgi:iron(III) transport system permease protein